MAIVFITTGFITTFELLAKTEITTRSIDKMASALEKEMKYDYDEYPFLKNSNYNSTIHELTKMAIREKIMNEAGTQNLSDIFDATIGKASTENYFVARMLVKYMVDEKLNVDEAIERLQNIITKRITDVETFAKIINLDELLKENASEITDELRNLESDLTDKDEDDEKIKSDDKHENLANDTSVFPSHSNEAVGSSADNAVESFSKEEIVSEKNIFEIMKETAKNTKDPSEAINKKLDAIPAIKVTIVKNIEGNTLDLLKQEKDKGNHPVTVHWRNDNYLLNSENLKSSKKTKKTANNVSCTYSEEVPLMTEQKMASENSKADFINCSVVNRISGNQEIRDLVRMQITIALLTDHDTLLVGMSGFNVPKKRLAEIGEIYKQELKNPLVQGKLQKIFFIKE